ncbi:hypothetical protein [Aeromonas caviae]|uniref:hypothetical protein n=1 Tax=Aeromonas caviae TaxID=648 RepID=UPI0030150F52
MIVKTFRLICSLVVAALLMAVLLALPYLYFREFGFLSKYSWHNDQSWANFGSFIGGTIGPFLSLLAFLGVLLTLFVQKKQFDLTKEQFEITKKTLSEDLELTKAQYKHEKERQLLSDLLGIISNTCNDIYSMFHDENKAPQNFKSLFTLSLYMKSLSKESDEYKKAITLSSFEIKLMKQRISFLCHVFNLYKEKNGDYTIIRMYRDHIGVEVIMFFSATGINDDEFMEYFPVHTINEMMNALQKSDSF